MADYKVQFDVFEGPLDLLLYLIKKEEVDIYEVNLTKIAEEFVQYLDLMRELDLDVAGEFLVMAATLMYIKSRELLPVDQQAPGDEEDAGDDPRWELIRQLVEYKKFKDAAVRLQDLELRQEHVYRRIGARPDFAPAPEAPRLEVSLFDLLNAVSEVLKRANRRDDLREIFEDKWTVSEKIETLGRLLRERPRLRFSELIAAKCTRSEVVVTFLALLELIRLKQIMAVQSEPFSEIELVSRVIPATATATAGAEEPTLAPPTA